MAAFLIKSSPATAKRRRAEMKVAKSVREQVAERDGRCRLHWLFADCRGVSEWAHLHSSMRSKTRRMAPDQRHSTAGTLMLCTLHHSLYDRHEFAIETLTEQGCDGRIAVRDNGQTIGVEA